jgi:hypothetical protein
MKMCQNASDCKYYKRAYAYVMNWLDTKETQKDLEAIRHCALHNHKPIVDGDRFMQLTMAGGGSSIGQRNQLLNTSSDPPLSPKPVRRRLTDEFVQLLVQRLAELNQNGVPPLALENVGSPGRVRFDSPGSSPARSSGSGTLSRQSSTDSLSNSSVSSRSASPKLSGDKISPKGKGALLHRVLQPGRNGIDLDRDPTPDMRMHRAHVDGELMKMQDQINNMNIKIDGLASAVRDLLLYLKTTDVPK